MEFTIFKNRGFTRTRGLRWRWIGTRQTSLTAAAIAVFLVGLFLGANGGAVETNLLKNPGFEETGASAEAIANWSTTTDSQGKAVVIEKGAHGGKNAVSVAPNTSIEQKIDLPPAGAYLARCWVKSESEQSVTLFVRNSEAPLAGYTCAEIKVPRDKWTQVEIFCVMDRDGTMTISFGGVSKEFHMYHGTGQDTAAPIIADDFELIRYETNPLDGQLGLVVWDGGREINAPADWSARAQWTRVDNPAHNFAGTPVIQAGPLAGSLRKTDGGLALYSIQPGGGLKQRCVIIPSPAIPSAKYDFVHDKDRTGVRVSAGASGASYTAWFSDRGLVRIEAKQVPRFQIADCRLRYGILPSFAGTDILYAPATMPNSGEFNIPSTQWLVGLADGNDSMLVATWETNAQPISLGLSGTGENRLIDSVSIGTEKSSFALSLANHANIWHRQPLNEDWLGEYMPIGWERPFPARWMCDFFVSPGGRASFREPDMNYSFPIACAKTRMWGVWFEDWNHYPCYFDGARTILHFEKTFVPQGDALIYFLEHAAADLLSPCEVVEQFLGPDKAAALFDFDANRLRKLKYSTPDQFMFDRPVCATTTRLSKIKAEEKPTVGVDLATHLYEFIREIRGRVDQYVGFFAEMKTYFAEKKKAHPEMAEYLSELDAQVSEAQARSKEIYATPLGSVQKKIDAMKVQLQEGKGDGYTCGNLDVRGTAGAQDDLCRWYNRRVLKLAQTAALKCGDSPEKAVVAAHVWDESRKIVRQPSRWESRRTLYFFEP